MQNEGAQRIGKHLLSLLDKHENQKAWDGVKALRGLSAMELGRRMKHCLEMIMKVDAIYVSRL